MAELPLTGTFRIRALVPTWVWPFPAPNKRVLVVGEDAVGEMLFTVSLPNKKWPLLTTGDEVRLPGEEVKFTEDGVVEQVRSLSCFLARISVKCREARPTTTGE